MLWPFVSLIGCSSGAFIIGCVIFKSLGKEEIWESLIATGRISASIYLILGASEVLSYVMTLGGMEDWMRHLALDVISDPTVFLLVTAAFVLLVGTFLEPAPATVLFVPIFVPAAQSLGVDQIQLGIVFVLTLTLGLLTPPVGLCLFVVQKIGNLKMSQLFRALIPFLIAQFVTVILLCLFTPLSTWLPNALK
ncbi:TRAP transporter large permease subunit [Ferrovibrio sp.]|uniref:TRAP transporter large permease subunit n=1 Tax=Ferrovibrio sp. TaxID=1917215 RepID=UPI0025B85D71|nr:TRAP transporter large permease subunit [Ferrovibrio sp.]